MQTDRHDRRIEAGVARPACKAKTPLSSERMPAVLHVGEVLQNNPRSVQMWLIGATVQRSVLLDIKLIVKRQDYSTASRSPA